MTIAAWTTLTTTATTIAAATATLSAVIDYTDDGDHEDNGSNDPERYDHNSESGYNADCDDHTHTDDDAGDAIDNDQHKDDRYKGPN